MSAVSIISIVGHNQSNCGYCGGKASSFTFGFWAFTLTCTDYQRLIDRGWRRSGQYVYKPDLKKSCCPQYTIRLDVAEFHPSKSQRQIINKFNRYIEGTWIPQCERSSQMDQDRPRENAKRRTKEAPSLTTAIHASEVADNNNKYELKIELEPASFTEEKFAIYSKYQQKIHHDAPEDIKPSSFRDFLVNSPLKLEPVDDLDTPWGSYHQKYLLDGRLIAVAVLDILPKCVSSVYFMYDPDYAFLGLGHYSALREISLTQELHRQSPDLGYYYMGYYIHDCKKMQYKGKFHPSELLDPETYAWYALDQVCRPLLDQFKYVSFAQPSEGIVAAPRASRVAKGDEKGEKDEKEEDDDMDLLSSVNRKDDGGSDSDNGDAYVTPGWLQPDQVTDELMGQVFAITENNVAAPVTSLKKYHQSRKMRHEFKSFAAAVGRELATQLIIY
ncbi:arginine-tRNA-protein transferase [Gongronella butleri]|nr:arginine-tRNA-protein transferase [Gongronella butleri]